MRRPVVIAPYDPSWPETFASIRSHLAVALGETAVDILHVGSTAVAGLAAKPIIDIDVVVANAVALAESIARLSAAGYVHRGDLGIEGRHAFDQPAGMPAHHLYVCEAGNAELKRHIALRDHLRSNEVAVQRYSALKFRLAAQFGGDRDGYTAAKTSFIEEMLLAAAQGDSSGAR